MEHPRDEAVREIKFRTWMVSAKYMKTWKDLENLNLWYMFQYQEDYKIMQYTGLKDKNGKEIYEGDICKISSVDDEGNWGIEITNTEIIYYNGCFKTTYYGFPVYSWAKNNNVDMEVIGNIYANPELLTP